MKQSEIFKKQIYQEKQRADKLVANFGSFKKILDKLLEIWFSR